MFRDSLHILFLLALLVIGSCTQESPEADSGSLVATMEAPVQTKVSVADPVPGTTYGVFTWDDDTRIAIHTNTGNGSYIIARMVEKSADGKTATFRPRLTGTRDGYAVFPITAADGGYPGVDARGFHVYWHKEHYVNNSTANWKERYTSYAETPMAAVNDPNSNTLEFKHLGGVLRLHIDQIPSQTKYIKVRSADSDPAIQGSFEVDLSGATPVVTPVSGEVGHSVNFVFSNIILSGVSATEGAINNVVLNLPVPPGTYNALRIEAWKQDTNPNSSGSVNYCRYYCDPVTVACGQVVDMDIPLLRYISGVVINPYKSTLDQQDVTISTLLRPETVTYRVKDLAGTAGTGTAYGNMHITCSTEDPSIAQVYVDKNETEAPVIKVFGVSPGTTTLHVWVRKEYYDEEVHGSGNVIVSPSSTFSVISPTTSMDKGSTMNLTVSSIPEGVGDRTLDYTWQIVDRDGASDASISWDRQKAVLSAGSELGWVDVNCAVSYNGSTPVTSTTLKILIGSDTRPDGVVDGLFKVSDTKLVFFGRANLYATSAEPDKYRLTEHQYDVLYSKDPNWSDSCTDIPYSFAEYDLFLHDVAGTTFGDPSTSPDVYWNNNDVDKSTGWYTLSGAEWKYLLETRRASTVAGTDNARYLKVRVGVHFGVVIFPDTYTHPASVQAIPSGRINNSKASCIDLRYEEWEDMERAGAVYLPAAGLFQDAERHIYFYHNSIVTSWSNNKQLFFFRINPLNASDNASDNYESPHTEADTYYAPIRLVKDMIP